MSEQSTTGRNNLGVADMEFVVTPRIQTACKACVAGLQKTSELRKDLEHLLSLSSDDDDLPVTVRLSTIRAVSEHLQATNPTDQIISKDSTWVHSILQGSHIYVAKPESPKRNPELVARLDKVRKLLEEREYMRMTANVSSHISDGTLCERQEIKTMFPAVPGVRTGTQMEPGCLGKEMALVDKQVSVIINIVFSGLGVGFAVGYASYTLTSEMGWRILMALAAAVVVVLAETWLFVFAGTRGHKKRIPQNLYPKTIK
ncbi:hypothetical protein LPJ57_008059 [Coemansia sp. RSA 486]|nr:hypothetical protein LPJ57_008059 [Coemansia sp. RSA 486]KAJ2233039.1 hypothetical protein IWW45_004494 [Coemansia sp. RSA 485]KAJ2602382.1 hypothetical protein GGF39_000746 [Coemansia sp. RSA 1721]KAJ2637192.1 hypothetical protein GGF40_002531 [Coemansia sp. RSA 1286]